MKTAVTLLPPTSDAASDNVLWLSWGGRGSPPEPSPLGWSSVEGGDKEAGRGGVWRGATLPPVMLNRDFCSSEKSEQLRLWAGGGAAPTEDRCLKSHGQVRAAATKDGYRRTPSWFLRRIRETQAWHQWDLVLTEFWFWFWFWTRRRPTRSECLRLLAAARLEFSAVPEGGPTLVSAGGWCRTTEEVCGCRPSSTSDPDSEGHRTDRYFNTEREGLLDLWEWFVAWFPVHMWTTGALPLRAAALHEILTSGPEVAPHWSPCEPG